MCPSCSRASSESSLEFLSYKYKRYTMKNLITIIAVLTITFTSAFATTTPETLISTTDVEVVTVGTSDIFTTADFDAATDNLNFTTNDNISVIQIFDAEGNLEFSLPVMSDNVKINKNLFGEGTYQLGFILEGQSQMHSTSVTVK